MNYSSIKILLMGILLVFIYIMPGKVNAEEFKINSPIEIVIGKKADILTKFAAEELKKHLQELGASNCEISTTVKGNALVFLLGQRPEGASGKLEKSQACYAIRGRNVYLWGENFTGKLKTINQILGAERYSRCGILSSVYLFLNRELGINWLCPGNKGIVCKKHDSLKLPDKADFSWAPPLNMAVIRVYWWRNRLIQPNNRFVPAALQCSVPYVENRRFEDIVWFRRMLLGTKSRIRYRHAFSHWWKKHGSTHPEWFGLTTYGQRGLPEKYHKRNKLCVSNDAVVDQIIKEWQEKGASKYLNVCPNDGTPGFCRCPKCMALDSRKADETFYDHLTDRYLNFWNRIADKAVKIRPDVMLVSYVYSYYRFPPRREKVKHPDNMLFGMVPMMFENNAEMFKKWQECGAKNVFLRPNDLCIGSPLFMGLEKRIYDKFKASSGFNLFGVDYDGACGVRTNDLAYYVVARMVTNPNKSFTDIESEYCSAYGKAADIVREFFTYYRKLGEASLKKATRLLKQQNRSLLDSGQLNQIIINDINNYYKIDDFRKAARILAKCKVEELPPECRKRFQDLVILNTHAEKSFLFISEAIKKSKNQPNQMEKMAKDLIKFRIKENKSLAWNWPSLWSRQEKKFWLMSNSYRKSVGLSNIPDHGNKIFWSSFDLPAMDGWRKRKLFNKLSSETASFDKFSVELTSKGNGGLAISRHAVKVIPGESYQLEYDYLLKKDNSPKYLRLRCVGSVAGKGVTMFNMVSSKKSEYWQTSKKTFKIPPGTNSITLYFIVGPGKNGSKAYLDRISLSMLKPKTEK